MNEFHFLQSCISINFSLDGGPFPIEFLFKMGEDVNGSPFCLSGAVGELKFLAEFLWVKREIGILSDGA